MRAYTFGRIICNFVKIMAGSAYWHSPPLSSIAHFNHAITYPFSHTLRNYTSHDLIAG